MSRAGRAVVVILLLCAATNAHAQTMGSAAALKRWVTAVTEHTPGRPDRAAREILALSYANRQELEPAMRLFLRAVHGDAIATGSQAQRAIDDLVTSVRRAPSVAILLRKAVVLHTDAAILRADFPAPPDSTAARDQFSTTIEARAGRAVVRVPVRPPPPPPLLWNERYVKYTDGRVVGEGGAEWNWPFARSLVDLTLSLAAADAVRGAPDSDRDRVFAADWYHAAAAYMLAQGNLGDLRIHLDGAADVLPQDARLRFDHGCYAETLGLSYSQALREDAAFWNLGTRVTSALPTEERTNGESEKSFRRTIEADDAYAEAHVRLARLLEHRGEHDEAALALQRAQARRPGPIVSFYAHLIGGQVAVSRKRYAEALAEYEAAAALFPDAQSALLGASQAAAMLSDVPRAIAFVQRLGERSQVPEADPWRYYGLGAGRDASELMAAIWAAAR